MAVHRDKSLSYDGPLRGGRGWWVLAAQQFRVIVGFTRTKLVVPLLWVGPLIAALLILAEFVFQGRTSSVEAPGGAAVGYFLQMQFYSLALLFAVTSAGVVSHDIRYNTTQLYFSKPLEFWEYPAGKLLALVGLGSVVTVVPAVLVGALRVALYSQYGLAAPVAADAAIGVGLSLVLTVVSAGVLLGLSSATRRTGFVVLAWLGVVVIPEVAAEIASLSSAAGEYAALMSMQGAIQGLAQNFVSGELTRITVALPLFVLMLWTVSGVALHVWSVRDAAEHV